MHGHNSSNADKSDEPVVTKTDCQLAVSQNLYETVSRLQDAIKVLQEYVGALNDNDTSTIKIKEISRNIKHFISPLSSNIAECIMSAAKEVAPMAGVPEIHRKLEVKRKSKATNAMEHVARKKTNLELITIGNFLQTEKSKDNETPKKKQPRHYSRTHASIQMFESCLCMQDKKTPRQGNTAKKR